MNPADDAISPTPPRNEWKDRVIDALIVTWAYKAEHEDDPQKAVADLIRNEIQMATDPVISKPMYDALKAAFIAGFTRKRSTFYPTEEEAFEEYYQELQK